MLQGNFAAVWNFTLHSHSYIYNTWIGIVSMQDKIKHQASSEGVLLIDMKQILRYNLITRPLSRQYKCYNSQFQEIIKNMAINKFSLKSLNNFLMWALFFWQNVSFHDYVHYYKLL